MERQRVGVIGLGPIGNRHADCYREMEGAELAGIKSKVKFDGESLMRLVRGKKKTLGDALYITECTWMRKHGLRTPRWKLIVALEPDFHFKPPVELYDLKRDPDENTDLAEAKPDVVAKLRKQMEAHIAKRTKATGLDNPMYHQDGWHGHEGIGYFESSRQAYDTLHIGDAGAARRLQAGNKDEPEEAGENEGRPEVPEASE